MELSTKGNKTPFIIDSIHGDIHLNDKEIKVIDTPTFQRLRQIKQLQMSHLTYPGATHTRFMHSLGVLGIMDRVQEISPVNLSDDDKDNLRLAALLHDIGHYPYSHLMEGIERVNLIEEKIASITESGTPKTLSITPAPYPEHVPLGAKILTSQKDIIDAIGSKERAKEIADLFSGAELDSKLSKLITSSLDLDRFDYLQRDAYATGLPYGRIDLNYLLNSLQMSPSGEIGVCDRAIPAVEHFLLARYFMHRTVYYHRTTVAFEEACRQLLRRLRDQKKCNIPNNGKEIESIISDNRLHSFTDAFVDNLIQKATSDTDVVIKSLAASIQSRNAPKLLKEILIFEERKRDHHAGTTFRHNCYSKLKNIADKYSLPLGLFLFCEPKPITFEKGDARFTMQEIDSMTSEDKKETLKKQKDIIQIFTPGSEEPSSILNFNFSIINRLSEMDFRIYRLYIVPAQGLINTDVIASLTDDVKNWDMP